MAKKYQIKLQQGKNSITAYGEFKSLDSCLAHFRNISTMKIAEIREIVYQDETSLIPLDDFNYIKQIKCYIKNDSTRKSMQIVMNNIKMGLTEKSLIDSIKQNYEIDNFKVDSVTSLLYSFN